MYNLPKPFFVLAPMDDVTDTVFRRVVAGCAAPDLYFTEFVNVEGLQSAGRPALQKKLNFTDTEKPLVVQLWGSDPEKYYQSAKELADLGYAGIDINFGCPEKSIVNRGCCSGMILPENHERAVEIIKAVQRGVDGKIPVSVKTRLGFNAVDFDWHRLLLRQNLDMLTIHGRTRKEMSKVPARWQDIAKVREIRDEIAPNTLIVGNGDVLSRTQGEELAKKYNIDGVMIGRGIFHDPFVFDTQKSKDWETASKDQRIAQYRKHVELFAETWKGQERKVYTLNRFCKVYIQNFDGAKELREKLMAAHSTDELLQLLSQN